MDRTDEILTEVRALRVDMTRAVSKLEELEKREEEGRSRAADVEARLRAVELGQAGRLAAASLGSGGVVALIQWVIQSFGG